ncbi:type II toxin-antitoxin system PemK/MazF family toxin [Desulfobacterota bacterium AH_259_B03_O07]|nr:type II toxin-antitoxin system PemK/MazF family toxin [Desulfobacterota bacterium AH_259_B03_O07]
MANLSVDAVGAEQKGVRPVVIIQGEKLNKIPNFLTTIVVPISTLTPKKAGRITDVFLKKSEGGLDSNSTARCHQIRAVAKERLRKKIGKLSDAKMDEIEQKLEFVLGFQ